MKCPLCDVALVIKRSAVHVEADNSVTVQDLVCPNRKCAFGKRGVVVKRVRHIRRSEAPDGQFKFCCESLIAHISDDSFYVPAGVRYTVQEGELETVCPICGSRHSYDVAGRTQSTDTD